MTHTAITDQLRRVADIKHIGNCNPEYDGTSWPSGQTIIGATMNERFRLGKRPGFSKKTTRSIAFDQHLIMRIDSELKLKEKAFEWSNSSHLDCGKQLFNWT